MFIYSKHFDLDWARHIFPVEKYKLVFEKIQSVGIAKVGDIFAPEPAKTEDITLVHTPEYLRRLHRLAESPSLGILEFEAPLTERTLISIMYHTGGTILTVNTAVSRKLAAINLGGGFHHAYSDRGGGFCFINDVAVAIRCAQKSGLLKTCIVVDLDLHQGNGTAKIFEGDHSVFTFSMHQEHLYPKKEKSSLDIGLPDFIGDDQYLSILSENLPYLLDSQKYDALIYLAGADPFEGDQIGSLKLTKQGLARRDEIVLAEAKKRSIPVAVTLAGGYAYKLEEVVDIHVATCREVRRYNFG